MNRTEALKIAEKAHAGQTDKCGASYILHPLAVARQFHGCGEMTAMCFPAWSAPEKSLIVVALLHDVFEDTSVELDDEAFEDEEWEALECISRGKNETYATYIEAVCSRPLSCYVKLADLWHNLSPERQACLPEKERRSLETRYLKARDRIWMELGEEWWPTFRSSPGLSGGDYAEEQR